jgi:outer membrane protein assembly factor BamB
MFQYTPDHNAVFDQPAWDVSWRADIGKASNGGLSIVGDVLYTDGFDHAVYAIDARTGVRIWRTELDDVLMNVPIVVGGIVIVGTGHAGLLQMSSTFWTSGRPEGDAIFGLDARTGRVIWRFDTVGENMPTGVYLVAGGHPQFVFSGGDDHVYSLDPATGRLLWKQTTLGIDGMASMNVFRGLVIGETTLSDAGFFAAQGSPTHSDRYFNWTWAIDPSNGQYVWHAPFGVGDASALVGDDTVFVQGFKLVQPTGERAAELSRSIGWDSLANGPDTRWANVVTAIDGVSGTARWSAVSAPGANDTYGSAAFTADSVFSDGIAYEPLPFARELAAFSARDGHIVWKIKTHGSIKTSPVIKDGILYVGDVDGYFYVIRAANGSVLHEIKFDGAPSSRGFAKCPPVIVGNTLYVSNLHYVYALRLSDLQRGIPSSYQGPATR